MLRRSPNRKRIFLLNKVDRLTIQSSIAQIVFLIEQDSEKKITISLFISFPGGDVDSTSYLYMILLN